MIHEHLGHDALHSLLRGQLPRQQTRNYLRHVLGGCSTCAARVREALSHEQRLPEDEYAQAFLDTANLVVDQEAPLARERIAAPGRSARLMELPWPQRRLLVATDARYRTFGLCERLIQESHQAIWSVHGETIVDRARCAVLVAEHIVPDRYEPRYVTDLLAFAHAALANGYRLNSQFDLAEQALDLAAEHLARGSGDELEWLRLASYRASLLTTLGHLEECVEHLAKSVSRAAGLGNPALHTKLLVQMANALSLFDPAAAILVYREAEARIDRALAPRLAFCARYNLIRCLNDCGHDHEALRLFDASRLLFRQFPDRWAQLHLRWTEARLAFNLGHEEEAEAALQRLWGSAFELDLRLETALISLHLIEAQVALGRHADAIAVARRLVDLFEAWRVHTGARHAWDLLLDSLRRYAASRELVNEVGRYLRRAWRNPAVRFARTG